MMNESRTRSFIGRLSIKRKHTNERTPSPLPKNSVHLLSPNDTLHDFLPHLEAAEREASQENRCPTVREDVSRGRRPIESVALTVPGLSPIPNLSPQEDNVAPIIFKKSASFTSRSSHQSAKQLDDSLNESEVLAVPISPKDVELEKEEQDLFEESLKLSDSRCEGASIDEEDKKQWEYSVFVPSTPKNCSNISPSNLSSTKSAIGNRTLVDCNRTVGIQKISRCNVSVNKTKCNISLQGLSDINWDESLWLVDKSPGQDDLPSSISFSQKLHQQLLSNNGNICKLRRISEVPEVQQNQPFFGLPAKVQHLIEKFRGIKYLYDWQKECLSMPAVQHRQNLVYALPTSGGKTLVAEILLLKEILINRKNTLFILPYVSIVQEKVRALSQLAVELDFFVEEYAAGKGAYPPKKRRCKNAVYVATIEKALGLVHSLINENRLHEVGLVVVDELHLLGEGSRGATLESVLTNLRYSQMDIQIVGMSATIGNLQEISSFLDAYTYTGDFRPVELKEYIKCGQTIYSINRNLIGTEESPLSVERAFVSDYSEEQLQQDPDQIGALVAEIIPDDSCLVFCPTRKNCENVALLICQTMSMNLKTVRVEEKRALYKALAAEGNGRVCPILVKTLPYGVAYHHSGLTAAERRLLEEAFLAQTVCVICCTSTLAAGVNLPARRVILRSPYIGIEFIDLSRYKQMVGRAGRAGFGGAGESILMCQFKDTPKVLQLLTSHMTESCSYLAANDAAGLKALVLHSVSLRLASCRSDIHTFLKQTLLWVQAEKLCINVLQLADQCILSLVSEGGFIIPKESNVTGTDDENVITAVVPSSNKLSDVKIHMGLTTPLTLSKIGEAAVKGSLTMVIAHRLYNDLHLAQEKMVLLNHLHLLYCVTPYSMIDQIKYVHQVYFNVFMELGAEELKVASVIGITEAVIVSVMKRRIVKNVSQEVVERFYLTLILYDLWHQMSIWDVSNKFQVSRGLVFSLIQAASSFASCVLRFSEVLEEFWCFKVLLEEMVQRLSHCCSVELIPLMELPAVKIGRARQLYNAGYHTLRDVASAEPTRLIRELDHMPRKTAYQVVAAAKLLLIQKAEALRDEASEYLDGLGLNINKAVMPPLT